MNSAALRPDEEHLFVLLLAFRFSSAVTCAQPLAAQAPAVGSEKFSSLASSRRNFPGPGVALRPPHADAILLCQQAKKIGGAPGPVTFISEGNDMQRIRLNTATEVLASIPTMLGFIPTASVIVIMLKDEIVDGRTTKQIALVTRTDAATGEGAEFDPAPYLEAAARAETTATICVAVAEDAAAVIALDQIAILRQEFRDAGIIDMLALHVTALEAGALWTDLDTYATGLTEDPNASTLSIHNAVEQGRTTAASREDIAARYAVTVEADTAPAHAALHAQGTDFVRHAVTELATLIRTRGNPDAELAARVGLCATISPTARDALLFTANGNEHAAAHAFATIARQVRGNARIQILTVAAYCSYISGDGPSTGIALEAAQAAVIEGNGEHDTPLRNLLDFAVEHAVSPAAVTTQLHAIGADAARSFGVDVDNLDS
ncbi:DUF4192 domain-containing protein (plasmid) [Rhodococcus qingshengii]|nr:hypothetical protein AOT96_34290 [Rhodococcus sp. 008]AUS35690.1 DUF4192 domain-containing protein [Rhodococcus qingshengii]